MAIGPAVFDASDGPVRASWRRGRNALDKNSAKIFEFRMAGSDGLGQRLLQGLARDRLARDLIVVFFLKINLIPMPLAAFRSRFK